MNPELLAQLLSAQAPQTTTTKKNNNFEEYVITDSNDVFMAFVNIKKDAVEPLTKVFAKLKVKLSPKDENFEAPATTYAI